MNWLVENSGTIGSVVGAIVGTWTLVSRIHRGVLKHFATHFASKQDLETGLSRVELKVETGLSRIEAKVDTGLELMWRKDAAQEKAHAVKDGD